MIEIKNLRFAYGENPPILDKLDLNIEKGSYITIAGKNGSGKSTLALLIKGLLTPSDGTITIDGLSFSDKNTHFDYMKKVGLVFQNPDDTFVASTVERELAFGLENLMTPPAEMKARISRALHDFDLTCYRHSNPLHLSGGERQRLAFASVVIMEPDYIILDEPTSLLDPWGKKDVYNALDKCLECGKTILHITQDKDEIIRSEKLIFIENGSKAYEGDPREAVKNIPLFESYENSLKSISPAILTKTNKQTYEKSILMSLGNIVINFDSGTPLSIKALSDISFGIEKNSSLAVLGKSGSGKSTLLELISGLIKPSSGKIVTNKNCLATMAFQFPEDQIFGDTVESYISFGLENKGLNDKEIKSSVIKSLEFFAFSPDIFLKRDPITLSGGEKRRLAIAAALSLSPEILVLDEPTAGLDRGNTVEIIGILKSYVSGGGTLVFSSHDFEFARLLADFYIFMESGKIIEYGKKIPLIFKNI